MFTKLNLALPYFDHPLFTLLIRRRRWARTRHSMAGHTKRVLLVAMALLGGLWLLGIELAYTTAPPYIAPGENALFWSGDVIVFAAIASVGVNFLSDFACVIMSLNSIDRQRRPVWWDMLHLTQLSWADIIAAHHTLIQTRLWRWTMVVTALRITVIMLTIIQQFILYPLVLGSQYSVFYYGGPPFIEIVMLIPTLVIFVATYVMEPVWRMKAMAALGLWISARVNSATMEGLTGFVASVGIWVVQGIITGLYFWVALQGMVGVYETAGLLCMAFFFCMLFATIIYGFYIYLQNTGLRAASQYLFER